MENTLIKPVVVPETRDGPGRLPRPVSKLDWRWIGLVCIFLGIAGGARFWRSWQVEGLRKESEKPPFLLKELPWVLGDWRAVEGSESTLEPEIARIAGASEQIVRTYVHDKTQESVSVIVLYGLAYLVWAHTPAVCYPMAGFSAVPPTRELQIPIPGSTMTARFRAENFVKRKAGMRASYEVYHSFRNAGQWDLDMLNRWKSFRYHPGMFKIQVQRQVPSVGEAETTAVEDLLGRFVQEIERRLVPKE